MVVSLAGCGLIEKAYDKSNYESLTNERGNILMYSGGKCIGNYKNIKIIYSDSNSFALWFETKEGKMIYWQGEAVIKLTLKKE